MIGVGLKKTGLHTRTKITPPPPPPPPPRLLAIRRNSNYTDNDEINEYTVIFTYTPHVLLLNPKRRYNIKHCTLPLLHGGRFKHILLTNARFCYNNHIILNVMKQLISRKKSIVNSSDLSSFKVILLYL